jgi:GLPGLI family protein
MLLKIKIVIIFFNIFSAAVLGQTAGKAYYIKTSKLKIGLNRNQVHSTGADSASINRSLYELVFNDSLAFYYKSTNSSNKIEDIGTGYSGPNFFHFKDQTVLRSKGKYLIIKEFKSFDWNLTNEETTFSGLHCYKAETNFEYRGRRRKLVMPVVAWYTLDICVPGGPDGFGGLPGLIVALEFDKVTTILHSIVLSEDSKTIVMPQDKIKVSEVQFKSVADEIINSNISN